MLDIFYNYFYFFLHPFKMHTALDAARKGEVFRRRSLRLADENESENNDLVDYDYDGMNLIELMSVSWILMLINTVYIVVSIYLGLITFNYMSSDEAFTAILLPEFSFKAQQIVLFVALGQAILYPITMWVYTKFWGVLIRFFANLFEFEGDVVKTSEQVVNYSLVSNMFLMIPVFGEVAKRFSSLIYIFAGLRQNFKFTRLQSVIVISSPILLLFMVLFFIGLYISIVLSIFL